MGKNRGAVGGLSRFLQAFKEPETPGSNAATTTTVTTLANSALLETQEDTTDSTRPTKKRKVGLLGVGHERYDATTLVQFYTDPSEVPDHLKKCTYCITHSQSLSR